MPEAQASWFEDAGATACPGERVGTTLHARYGIADRTLPCRTKVTLCHVGRCVVATVEDRGPFVYSRLFDLNPSVKSAIACPDLCTVGYRVW